uniref:Uncharacterized protein n=1 Tax=Neobodo designis TaxID=312471 RepID=A0A7S1MCC2_NEODS|mmetsp:Transcript_36698/g.113118  ORF Transcript_36698/g.113118 Transcript_36698/m.113118 type:complete len:101 (+) Transcript_36698:244-546(+)
MGYGYAEGAVRKLMDGWVTVKPRVASSMSKDAAWRLLRESYVAVAPKTLAKLVPGEAASPVAHAAKTAPKKTAPKKAAPKKAAVARKAPTVASAAKRKAK